MIIYLSYDVIFLPKGSWPDIITKGLPHSFKRVTKGKASLKKFTLEHNGVPSSQLSQASKQDEVSLIEFLKRS